MRSQLLYRIVRHRRRRHIDTRSGKRIILLPFTRHRELRKNYITTYMAIYVYVRYKIIYYIYRQIDIY